MPERLSQWTCRSIGWTLQNVDLSGATFASLNLNIAQQYSPSTGLQYRLNGGPWRPVADPIPGQLNDWRAVSAPVALSDLRQGSNTLDLAAAQTVVVTNIDVTVSTMRIRNVWPSPAGSVALARPMRDERPAARTIAGITDAML